MSFRTMWKSAGAAILTMLAVSESRATISFGASGAVKGENLSALATFTDLGGGQLLVTLANTYTNDTPDQPAVLTGLFFDFAGGTNLSPISATAATGSHQWQGSTESAAPASSILGTEWAYEIDSKQHSTTAEIVSAGYGTPGMGNFASPGDMLDGSAWGLVSAGYAGSDLDGLGSNIYIQGSINFVLSGFSGSVSNISNVTFQYGTTMSEPSLTAMVVPEPASVRLAALGATLFIFSRRARKR